MTRGGDLRTGLPLRRRGWIAPILCIGLVSIVGLTVAMRGWRARVPDFDTLPDIVSAHAFVADGRIPDRGLLSSFRSYIPPGGAWLLVPGVVASRDPRLAQVPGAALLYIGTLIGVFVLTRRWFGLWPGCLAVVLFGLSDRGVYFAETYGPRGHPFFYVWMLYLLCEWVARRDARYLAGALTVWGLGMYLLPELAPAILAAPVLWFVWRPPVATAWILVGAVALACVWSPYLRFESMRGFADMKSQVLREPLESGNATLVCDQTAVDSHTPVTPDGDNDRNGASMKVVAGRHVLAVGRGLLANFHTPSPILDGLLLVVVLGTAAVTFPRPQMAAGLWKSRWLRSAAFGLGVLLLLLAVLCSESTVRTVVKSQDLLTAATIGSLRATQAVMIVFGIALVFGSTTVRTLRWLRNGVSNLAIDRRPLVLSLLISWAVLLVVAEHGRPDRFSFLWPVQAAIVAAALAGSSRQASCAPWRRGIVAAVLAAIVVGAPVQNAAYAMVRDGWAGEDAEEVRLADAIAARMQASQRHEARIGYVMAQPEAWGARFSAVDRRYKLGATFDLFLQRAGINNLNTCAEGISSDDDIRIVQRAALSDPHSVLDGAMFALAGDSDSYTWHVRR